MNETFWIIICIDVINFICRRVYGTNNNNHKGVGSSNSVYYYHNNHHHHHHHHYHEPPSYHHHPHNMQGYGKRRHHSGMLRNYINENDFQYVSVHFWGAHFRPPFASRIQPEKRAQLPSKQQRQHLSNDAEPQRFDLESGK